jgi:hypothetical protein
MTQRTVVQSARRVSGTLLCFSHWCLFHYSAFGACACADEARLGEKFCFWWRLVRGLQLSSRTVGQSTFLCRRDCVFMVLAVPHCAPCLWPQVTVAFVLPPTTPFTLPHCDMNLRTCRLAGLQNSMITAVVACLTAVCACLHAAACPCSISWSMWGTCAISVLNAGFPVGFSFACAFGFFLRERETACLDVPSCALVLVFLSLDRFFKQ